MQHIVAGLYLYPFVQVKGELRNDAWPNKFDFTPGAGAGMEYQFNSSIGAFVQCNYDIALVEGMGRPVAKAGVVFAFGGGKAAGLEAKKKGLEGVVASNAAQARAARQAAKAAEQREKAEQAAADQMRKEAAEQAQKAAEKAQAAAERAEKFEDEATKDAYITYHAAKPSSVSIPFVQGSYEIGNTSKTKIIGLVPYLLSNPNATVEIKAYGDKLSQKSDETLAAKREKAVRDILTSAGIATERIIAGETSATQAVTAQPGSVAIVTVK